MKPITVEIKEKDTKTLERLTLIAASSSVASAIYLLISQLL
jgi:hypothetical protein